MEALLVVYLGLVIWVIVICVQKGKPGMAWLGLLTGWTVTIGAIRIAKPNSTWARKHYPPGGQKMALAMARFPEGATTSVADDLTGVVPTYQPDQDAEAQTEAIEAEVSKFRNLAESKDWKFRVVSRSTSRVVFKTRQPGFVWRRAAVHVVDGTVVVTDL